MKNFHEQSGEKWVCLCMCDVDSVDCRPQLLPFITTCQNGRHFLPPHTQKANQCCFFLLMPLVWGNVMTESVINKITNVYTVCTPGVELWFKVVSLFPNCVYTLDGLIWNNSFVINNMYRRLGSAREIRNHTSKKFLWKQHIYDTTDVFFILVRRPNEFQLQKKLESYTRKPLAKCHAPSVEIEEEIKTSRGGELPEMEFV